LLIAKGLLPQRITPDLLIGADLAKKPRAAAEFLRDIRGRFAGPPTLRLTTVKVFLAGVMEFPAQSAAPLDADGWPVARTGRSARCFPSPRSPPRSTAATPRRTSRLSTPARRCPGPSRWSCTPRARRATCMTAAREPFDRVNGPI
jgi:hypothetical protein